MTSTDLPGGTFSLGGDLTVTRVGYGAMQLAGKGVFGPPADREAAMAVLREVIALGITHIDTSDFYGPHVTNEIIAEALRPYPADLHIVTKVGSRRDDKGNWLEWNQPEDLRQGVQDNLQHLGLDTLDVVNLRMGTEDSEFGADPIEEPFTAMAQMQQDGLIRHLGVSNVSAAQLAAAEAIAPVVCVQNQYNLAHREDDAMIDDLASRGIAFVPFFPLGGFSPLQSEALSTVAQDLDATPMSVALAWLLQRSPNILLIPGTSSVDHLRDNVAGAGLTLPAEALEQLNGIAG